MHDIQIADRHILLFLYHHGNIYARILYLNQGCIIRSSCCKCQIHGAEGELAFQTNDLENHGWSIIQIAAAKRLAVEFLVKNPYQWLGVLAEHIVERYFKLVQGFGAHDVSDVNPVIVLEMPYQALAVKISFEPPDGVHDRPDRVSYFKRPKTVCLHVT